MKRAPGRQMRVAALTFGLCICAAFTWWWNSRVTLHESPLANVPASAMGLVHVRWPELQGSRLWQDVVVARGGDRALRALEEDCGFDWSADLVSITAFAHTSPADGGEMLAEHVAFILTGPLQLERMIACAPLGEGELEESDIDGVRAFRAGQYSAAVLDDGALLVGHVDALREVIQTVQGRGQSLADVPRLRTAFDLVSQERHLSAVFQLDGRWQRALEDVIEAQTGGREEAPEFVVAGARVARGLTFGAVAHFESSADADSFEARLRQLREEWSAQLAVALSPLGPALRSVESETAANQLHVAFDLDARRIDALIGLLETEVP